MDDRGRTIVNLALARHGEAGIVRFSAVFRNDHNCLGNLLVRRAEGSRDAAGGGADRHAGVVIAGLGRNRALREIFSVDGRSAQVTAADAGNRKLAGFAAYFQQFQCCPEP